MGQQPERPSQRSLSGWSLAAAMIALALWAGFTTFMVAKSDETSTSEIRWTRLAWLFSSVEAVAFGAAGALFGASVQRERAEKAEQTAAEHQEAASRGRALSAALMAEAEAAGVSGGAAEAPGQERRGIAPEPADQTPDQTVIQRHAALARTMFPDRGSG